MTPTVSPTSRPGDVTPFAGRLFRPLIRLLNPLIVRIAGRRWTPMLSVLRHRGHRTGRLFTTPLMALPRGGWFWLVLTFGEQAGWVRNVLAARECTVLYRGVEYHLVDPVVLEGRAVGSQLPGVARFAMRMAGIHKVLRLRAG